MMQCSHPELECSMRGPTGACRPNYHRPTMCNKYFIDHREFQDDSRKITELRSSHPRLAKLLDSGKFFLVVARDEPYFWLTYGMLREVEITAGRWTADDEKKYQDQAAAEKNNGK